MRIAWEELWAWGCRQSWLGAPCAAGLVVVALACGFLVTASRLGVTFPRGAPGIAANAPQHLMLVTFENLRADHCSAWQYPRPTTFVERGDDVRALDLDHLVESGVAFAQTFAPSGSLLPSLGTLLTGAGPQRHKLHGPGHVLDAEIQTLAEGFARHDFATVAFVMPSRTLGGTGLERGFELYLEFDDALETIKAAAQWLMHKPDPDQRHFLWLHVAGPSWPWEPEPLPVREAPADFRSLFRDPLYRGQVRGDLEFLGALRRGELGINPEDRDALVSLYDGEVARANLVMRQFLEYYKHLRLESDLWGRTLIVATAASGMELGERGHWGAEGSLHDGGLHVPLVFRHPPSLTGRRILNEVVELADVAPTLFEWFGFRPPYTITGRALFPLLSSSDGRTFATRPALASRCDEVWSVRDGR